MADSSTAMIRTRETCSCGAVFESDKDITWSNVEKALEGFRTTHAPCRQRSSPMFPLGPIADYDPCAGCSPYCDSIACPKRTVITYGGNSTSPGGPNSGRTEP